MEGGTELESLVWMVGVWWWTTLTMATKRSNKCGYCSPPTEGYKHTFTGYPLLSSWCPDTQWGVDREVPISRRNFHDICSDCRGQFWNCQWDSLCPILHPGYITAELLHQNLEICKLLSKLATTHVWTSGTVFYQRNHGDDVTVSSFDEETELQTALSGLCKTVVVIPYLPRCYSHSLSTGLHIKQA